MADKFERAYEAILFEREDVEKKRIKPVFVGSIRDKQPLTVLEGLIKMWPVHDVRYQGYGTLDDPLMIDMIKGAQMRVVRKDLHHGIIEVVVDFIRNLDEIERYNAAVKNHNRAWIEHGSQTEVFDPVHGDIHKVADQYVDPVLIQSEHYDLPKSAYQNVSTGPLAKARPEILRKSHIKIRYQMSITAEDYFVVGYAAYDYEGRIIYYNEVSHQDLAYLVRRSVQEIWGNPVALKQFDNLLEGISMLLNGKKLYICQKDNRLPEFLRGEDSVIKSTKAIKKIEMQEDICEITSGYTATIGPIVCILGFMISLGWMIATIGSGSLRIVFPQISDGGIGSIFFMLLEIFIKPPMILSIICLVLTVYFRKATLALDRKASALKARGKFL